MDYESVLINALEDKSLPYEVTAWIEETFPSIVESKDEKIRKHLIKHFSAKSKENWNGISVKDILAWLDKKGHKESSAEDKDRDKPAKWSKTDEGLKNCLIATLCEDEHGGREKNDRFVKWLDKFPQKYWRPKKKHIVALRYVLNHLPYCTHKEVLVEMLDQIKDL